MTSRTYPYTAWLLTRTFELKEVELVDRGFTSSLYDRSSSGRNYPVDELHMSAEAAIAFGEQRLSEQADDITRRLSALLQRRERLHKLKSA